MKDHKGLLFIYLFVCFMIFYTRTFLYYNGVIVFSLAPGRFAQKPVPPGTVRAKKKFERDVSSRDDSRIFPKIDFKVLFIKIYQLNAMDM